MMRRGVLGIGALRLAAASLAGCSGQVLAPPTPCDESGRGPDAGNLPASSADGSSDGLNDEQSPDAESGISDAVGVSSPDAGATPTCTGPTATTRISVVANVSAVSAPPPAPWDAQDPDSTSNFSFGVVIFHGAGSPHDGLLFFVNTGTNAWEDPFWWQVGATWRAERPEPTSRFPLEHSRLRRRAHSRRRRPPQARSHSMVPRTNPSQSSLR